MKKVEYRCHRCMLVLSVLISDLDPSTEYIACSQCGEKSKRIGISSIAFTNDFDHAEN